MSDNTVALSQSGSGADLEFSAVFNVAPVFIDRHIDENRGNKVCIRATSGETVLYSQLFQRVNQAGNALLALGIQPGDRVLMVVKDCPEFYYLFWGAIKAGIVPVPVNTLLRARDYSYIIDNSEGKALIYSAEFSAEVEPAIADVGVKPAHCLQVSGGDQDFVSLLNDSAEELTPALTTAEDDCFWLYSSGSTGRPKGAIHRHRDMVVASQKYGCETLHVNESDVCFSAAKLFFAYGLGNGMTFPLWSGATAILYDQRPTPKTTFAVIEEFRPTLYFGVPTLYAAQLQEMAQEKPDLSSLRACVSAGEALPADILKRWKQQTGLDILDGIGSTEALHIFVSNRLDDIQPGTSGTVVPGYQARIVDDNGEAVATGESGHLLIKGDSTARCYWKNPQKTAATMVDGWLNTGDTYILDENGYYRYCGRNDDMLKIGGIWCSPFEIEDRLTEHPAVLEVAVVGREDEEGLVKPEAFVVLQNPDDQSEDMIEQLTQHCKQGLAPYKYPRWINFAAELPKTATGKIQRFKLRT